MSSSDRERFESALFCTLCDALSTASFHFFLSAPHAGDLFGLAGDPNVGAVKIITRLSAHAVDASIGPLQAFFVALPIALHPIGCRLARVYSAGAAPRAINIIAIDAPKSLNHVAVSSWGTMSSLDRSNMILSPNLDYHLTARLADCRTSESGHMSDVALPIVLGIALAAATGFRVFLPMLIVSAAAYTGHLPLDNSFAWLGTPAALTMLSVAALAEVLAYYIPVVDNLLDTLATPAAFIAGTVISAAVMTDVPPMVKWTAAVIAGGGIAGLTQGATAALRAHSTVLTGGLGNPIIATVELGGALLMSFLALIAPAAAVALVILFLWLAIRLLRQVFPGVHSKNRTQ